jgi:hypothetical protein
MEEKLSKVNIEVGVVPASTGKLRAQSNVVDKQSNRSTKTQ